MKVGVFAGTHEDTRMGVDLLRERGFESLPYPISENPKDQSLLQYYSKEDLTRLVEEKIVDARLRGQRKFLSTATLFRPPLTSTTYPVVRQYKLSLPWTFIRNLTLSIRS